jgi:hypothetical protein
METRKNRSVFFLVFISMQRGFAVAEIAVSIAEEGFVVVAYPLAI